MRTVINYLLPITSLMCLPAIRSIAADRTPTVLVEHPPSSMDNFHAGGYELTLGGGSLFSPIGHPKNRPTVNYAIGQAQLGLMLTDVAGPSILRGNAEFVWEGFGASIYDGPGNYIAGGTLWMRYNFVPLNCPVVPYGQLGAGFLFTDIDHRYDGQNFNFNLDAAAGLRIPLCSRSSLNLEYRAQHISNANTGKRNIGINSQGPIASISWFF
jgi:Lipid A 3-O-deacylase (PagL)